MARSLLGRIVNRSPVDLRPRTSLFGTTVDKPDERALLQMDNVSTVFAVVDGISSEVAAATWRLYRGDSVDDPDRVEVTRHAALSVWEKPNPFQTRAEFVESSQQHYELTGEYWWTVSRQVNGRRLGFPVELWGVRPDRIEPVPSERDFISGYLYTGKNGEDVPLGLDQVIWNKRPNPMTPYRGLSPLGSLIYDTNGDVAAAKYNYTFFKNGADPGGIIKSTMPPGSSLSDDEFDVLMQRWRESHRGVANAHRVGFLENAEFVPMTYTRRDMEFVDLRNYSKETIREAYRFPRSMMGSEAASNRATHEAEKQVFADNIVKPRLRRLRASLNDDFLPMFPGIGRSSTSRLWFDFDDPSPDDRENQRADLEANLLAADYYIGWGADKNEALELFDLPDAKFEEPEPQPIPPEFMQDEEEEDAEEIEEEDD